MSFNDSELCIIVGSFFFFYYYYLPRETVYVSCFFGSYCDGGTGPWLFLYNIFIIYISSLVSCVVTFHPLVEWCWHLTIATSPVQYLIKKKKNKEKKNTPSLIYYYLNIIHEFRLISVKDYIKENKPYTELFVFYLFIYTIFLRLVRFYLLIFIREIFLKKLKLL